MSPPSEPVISFGRSSPAATGTAAASTIWATLIPQYQIRAVVACRSYQWIR